MCMCVYTGLKDIRRLHFSYSKKLLHPKPFTSCIHDKTTATRLQQRRAPELTAKNVTNSPYHYKFVNKNV